MAADDEYDPEAHAKAAAYLGSLAIELGNRAVLREVEEVSEGQRAWTLTRRNPSAITVRVEVDPTNVTALSVEYLDQVDTVGIDYFPLLVAALISGNVRTLEGAGRKRVEVTAGRKTLTSDTSHEGWRGLLPAPRWKKGARRGVFEAYK